MPMLTFYFPFPFLLIAILDWFLPYTIAFKIITVLGVFALPATVYGFGRLLRVRRPFPIMAAIFATAMLLMESYSIYGGNVLSTLAGEFGYMFSFALVWLFLGTLYRGMQKPGLNMLFVLNCLILMALVLSHIVTTIVLVTLVPGLLLVNRRWKSLLYAAAVAFVGLCLTAFWWLPFASNLEWTAHMAWDQLHSLKDVLPTALLPAAALALIGIAYAIARKERRLLPLAWITCVTMVLFWALPDGRLWNARVLPFFYMSVHLWAAYGATWLVRPFAVMMRDLFRLRGLTARRVYVPVTAIVIGAVLVITSTTAAGWIKWNYSGYEGKANWPQYKQILDYLDTLEPQGRVMTEHGQKIDEFGTPRAFEIIPYWTKQDTMEGTLMEASYTAAFHFINQAELSEQASNAIIGVDYPGVDVHRGLTHLQLMNIPYLITFVNADGEERVTTEVQEDGRATELAVFGDYHLFRIAGTTRLRRGHEERAGAGEHPAGGVARHGQPVVPQRGCARHSHRVGQRRGSAPGVPGSDRRGGRQSARSADRHAGQRDQRDLQQREAGVRHHRHRQAPLDQDLLLPQLARRGRRRTVPGFTFDDDGHPEAEPRDALLRPHGRQHHRPDPGSVRLAHRAGPHRLVHRGLHQAPPPQGDGGGFGRGADGWHRCRRARLQGAGPLHGRTLRRGCVRDSPRPTRSARAARRRRAKPPAEEERGLTEEDFLDEEDNSEDANLRTDDLDDEGPVSTNY